MDSLKLQLYLRARERIQQKESVFCCLALREALRDFGLFPMTRDRNFTIETLKEFFPEFFDLFAATYWNRGGEIHFLLLEDSAWWEYPWREPRLRALDIAISRAGG